MAMSSFTLEAIALAIENLSVRYDAGSIMLMLTQYSPWGCSSCERDSMHPLGCREVKSPSFRKQPSYSLKASSSGSILWNGMDSYKSIFQKLINPFAGQDGQSRFAALGHKSLLALGNGYILPGDPAINACNLCGKPQALRD